MTTQPDALRLADALDRQYLHACATAAAELRRLSAVETQRDALLEALREAVDVCIWPNPRLSDAFDKARAAIKAVEEGK